MRLLPVLDLLGGQVVRGVAGRRSEYRPVVSRLTSSSEPVAVARAIGEHFGLGEFYLADLDAISGSPPALAVYAALRAAGFRLWVDAGLRGEGDATPLVDAGVEVLVAGLETLRGPGALAELVGRHGGDRVAFSLDLKGGMPLGDTAAWATTDTDAVAERAVTAGVGRLIVLDLSRVGVSAGTGTEDLCRRLRAAYPKLELVAGGGVRGPEDLLNLKRCGVDAALVASALHDGRLRPEDLAGL